MPPFGGLHKEEWPLAKKELEQLDEAFEVYEGLGENDSAHKVYEDIKWK